MGDQWPREAKELDPQKPLNGTGCSFLKARTWLLKTSIIGKNRLAQWGGKFNTSVESLTCLGQRFYNATAKETQWWGPSNHSDPNPHPLSSFHTLRQAWNPVDTDIEWRAPGGFYLAALVWGQGLYARDNMSLLFPPPLTSR
jgi:hypothetical protein